MSLRSKVRLSFADGKAGAVSDSTWEAPIRDKPVELRK
jgi:hypothetical protein